MTKAAKQFVFCLSNDGYEASLERGKVYLNLPDRDSEKLGLLRVVDESGEDYLFPKARFVAIDLPQTAQKAVLYAA